jgi:hypothetical protein
MGGLQLARAEEEVGDVLGVRARARVQKEDAVRGRERAHETIGTG